MLIDIHLDFTSSYQGIDVLVSLPITTYEQSIFFLERCTHFRIPSFKNSPILEKNPILSNLPNNLCSTAP